MLFGFVLALSLHPLSSMRQCISRHRPIKQITIIILNATRSLITNLFIILLRITNIYIYITILHFHFETQRVVFFVSIFKERVGRPTNQPHGDSVVKRTISSRTQSFFRTSHRHRRELTEPTRECRCNFFDCLEGAK